jgi:hypothetical protein
MQRSSALRDTTGIGQIQRANAAGFSDRNVSTASAADSAATFAHFFRHRHAVCRSLQKNT